MEDKKLQKQIDHIEETVDIIARAVANGFGAVEKEFGAVGKKFELQEKLLVTVTADIRDLKEGQLLQDRRLDEIEVVVRGISRAVDKDAVKIITQDRRIARLERVR
ncbi:MAG: hypothetical protein Q7S26_03360 [bacterium]|nr:hypothetical protein [bacterium]